MKSYLSGMGNAVTSSMEKGECLKIRVIQKVLVLPQTGAMDRPFLQYSDSQLVCLTVALDGPFSTPSTLLHSGPSPACQKPQFEA
jgi:hypothetical protein